MSIYTYQYNIYVYILLHVTSCNINCIFFYTVQVDFSWDLYTVNLGIWALGSCSFGNLLDPMATSGLKFKLQKCITVQIELKTPICSICGWIFFHDSRQESWNCNIWSCWGFDVRVLVSSEAWYLRTNSCGICVWTPGHLHTNRALEVRNYCTTL